MRMPAKLAELLSPDTSAMLECIGVSHTLFNLICKGE